MDYPIKVFLLRSSLTRWDLIPREWEAGDDHTNGCLVGTTEKNLVSQQFPFENGPGVLLYGCSLRGEGIWRDRFSYLLAGAF